jgi:hypothetical protein
VETILVPGDAAAMARNISMAELSFRLAGRLTGGDDRREDTAVTAPVGETIPVFGRWVGSWMTDIAQHLTARYSRYRGDGMGVDGIMRGGIIPAPGARGPAPPPAGR